MRRLQMFLAAVGLLVLAAGAQGSLVNVSLEPTTGTVVEVGHTFDLELWFRSSPTGVIVHHLDDLGLHWDPAYVGFDGPASTADGDYAWSDAMSFPGVGGIFDIPMYWDTVAANATYTDGDAELMLAPQYYPLYPGMGLPTTDQHQLTLTFTALAVTNSSTSIWLTTSDGVWAENPDAAHVMDVTGDLTGASATITPEPASLIIWGLLGAGCAGGAGWRRRRRGATGAPWTEENRQAIRQIVDRGRTNA